MSSGVFISAQELAALHGCGPLSTCCYLWLRAWMDYDTGRVGAVTPLSRGKLLAYSEVHVPRGAGVQVMQATTKELRVALDRLERAGLAQPVGGGDVLVFLLPMAQTNTHAQNKQGRVRARKANAPGREPGLEPGLVEDAVKPLSGNGFGVVLGGEQGREQGRYDPSNRADMTHQTGPTSKIKGNTSTPQPPSTTGREVDAGAGQGAAVGLAKTWAGEGSDPLSAADRKVVDLVAWLRRNGAAVQAANPKVRAWVEEGIDEGLIARALDVAKDDRGPSPQPVNAGLLDAIVRRLLVEQARPPRARNWAVAPDVELAARAQVLGVATYGKSRSEVVAAVVAREARQ